jgi:hypothetical protein
LNIELEEHTKADHDYKITIAQVFSITRRIGAIFASSEVPEKRAILNFLLQNPKVSGKKLTFTMQKPFDAILEMAACPTWLPSVGKFRTLPWADIKRELGLLGFV